MELVGSLIYLNNKKHKKKIRTKTDNEISINLNSIPAWSPVDKSRWFDCEAGWGLGFKPNKGQSKIFINKKQLHILNEIRIRINRLYTPSVITAPFSSVNRAYSLQKLISSAPGLATATIVCVQASHLFLLEIMPLIKRNARKNYSSTKRLSARDGRWSLRYLSVTDVQNGQLIREYLPHWDWCES